jgi:hypothetical protein
MSDAGAALQAGAMARIGAVGGLAGVWPGAPLQTIVPYAIVEAGAATDWGCKGREGREVRLSIAVYDDGERPQRIQSLMSAVEAALAEPPPCSGWQIASFAFVRSRLLRQGRGGSGGWAGSLEFRARLLALPS